MDTGLASRGKWLIVMPVLAVILAGCGSQSPTAGNDVGPTASTEGTSDSTPSSAPTTPSDVPKRGAAEPDEAVKVFVTRVLNERYTKACMASAPVLPTGREAAAFCAQPMVRKSLTALHDSWAKPGVTLPPEGKLAVTVEGEPASGTITVPDTAVTLDGRSLRELELIGSSGDTDSFRLSFDVEQKDGRWYVESWDVEV